MKEKTGIRRFIPAKTANAGGSLPGGHKLVNIDDKTWTDKQDIMHLKHISSRALQT
jgi:hypothetical protein